MSTNEDYRSDIEMYMDLWDDAQKDKAFQNNEPLKPNDSAPSQWTSAQDVYYDYLDSSEGGEELPDDEEMMQGEEDEFMLQEGDKFVNPVYPDSVGKDSDVPEPAWVSEDLLKKIEALKNRMFEVENRAARMGQGKNWSEKAVVDNGNKLMAEIESIRKQIDKVSNKLGIEDENCPWRS